MAHAFTWTCQQCGRSVPRRVARCRCGASTSVAEVTPPADPGPPQVAAPTASTGNSRVLLASAIVAVAVLAAAAILARAWRPMEPAPAAQALAALPPASAEIAHDGPAGRDLEPAHDLHVPGLVELMSAATTAGGIGDAAAPLSVEEVVTRSLPAVVKIETRVGSGSGFFVARDTLLTNAHVVGSETAVNLRLAGGERRGAGVEQVWREADLAVLKIAIVDLDQVVLPLARPEDVRIGAEVIAIGSPLGLQNTVTRGIVSGKREYVYDRIGRQSVNVVQTDAAINPGNSGGPLIDRFGRVVGVNTMKIGAGAGVEGLGFAVDMWYARKLLGADFALKSAADERRETGLRDYERAVRILAMRADEAERRWQQDRGTCFAEAARAQPRTREWFVLASERPGLLRETPACEHLNPFYTGYAQRMRDALRQYEETALEAGVGPDTLLLVRRRYNLAWPEWEARPR